MLIFWKKNFNFLKLCTAKAAQNDTPKTSFLFCKISFFNLMAYRN